MLYIAKKGGYNMKQLRITGTIVYQCYKYVKVRYNVYNTQNQKIDTFYKIYPRLTYYNNVINI